MKKNYFFLLASAMLLASFSMKAQVANYVFSQQQSTFVTITGGTVFAGPTTDDGAFCNPGAPATNLTTGPGIPIGFPFTFNSNVFDVFGIDNNGWIAFGQSTLTPNPVNLNNTGLGAGISGGSTAPALLQHRVVAVGRDLVSNNGTLRVETIGTAPNRVCVIQWLNYRVFGGSDNMSFQIRLNETTNIVEVVFGSWNMTTTSGGQCGLRGSVNTDFNNRNVTAPNVWATSIPGTVNTSLCNWNTTGLIPNNGQKYEWIPPSPCVGAPASNSVVSTFSMICPAGATNLNLANSYTNTGISYQWYVSDLSAVGPFTIVPTATAAIYSPSNVTVTSWYQAVVTCSNGPTSTTASAVNVMIAPTTTSLVPYHEGFEGIIQNNQLPNCSWSRSNPLTTLTFTTANTNNRIPHSGSKFASFRFGTAATGDYFYSNGIQLEPGITYSAAVWYITDGNLGWSELSLNYGTSQTSTGLTSIASVTGAVTGQFYQLLSNTFTVPNSGIYYLAIKCIGNSVPQFLTFDDISVTIPCELNSPNVNLIINPPTLCAGQEVNAVATGADSYNWSTGAQSSAITFTPFANMNLQLVATSSLSGCSSTITEMLTVNASPVVSIFGNSSSVCLGSTATLQAIGANTYTWSTGASGPSATVAPTTASSYTVLGSNGIGCIGTGVFNMGVNQLPNVTATSSAPNELCVNETATLTANGALTYQWINNSIIITTQVAYVSPNASTIYTLVGTDANGCSASTQVPVNVLACVGVNELSSNLIGLKLYPNPANADFTVELANGANKQVDVIDVTGRIVVSVSSQSDLVPVNLQNVAAGVYYVKVTSENNVSVTKLIKN